MKTYLLYKNQVQAFQDIQATIKTIEKIAASNIHLLKEKVSVLNRYSAELEQILKRIALFHSTSNNPLLVKRIGKKDLIIVTGEKGLVGGLWHDIVNAYLERKHLYQHVIIVGQKGVSYLKEEGIAPYKAVTLSSKMPSKEEVGNITNLVFSEFKKGTISGVDILYPRFVSLGSWEIEFRAFLPFDFSFEEQQGDFLGFPIFEPSKGRLINALLEKYIETFFFRIILESKLSEFSARTVTSEHASKKTEEIIHNTKLNYLKERRVCITERQLESFVVHKAL